MKKRLIFPIALVLITVAWLTWRVHSFGLDNSLDMSYWNIESYRNYIMTNSQVAIDRLFEFLIGAMILGWLLAMFFFDRDDFTGV